MAVQEESFIMPSDEEMSSLGDETYSVDSELELADLSSGDELDRSLSFAECSYERVRDSPLQTPARAEVVFRSSYTSNLHTLRTRRPNHDLVDEGIRLYLMFLQQEIMRNRLRPPEYLNSNDRIVAQNISSLRSLADQFATSTQRQWIRQQAQMVPLHSLNFRSFTDLLIGLFQEGGVTWERILVLFFFCTDISIRALQEQLGRQFQRIQNWTSRFIQDTVCVWVEMEGGWGAIFHQSVTQATKFAILGFCCVGIIALCIYIRNNAK